MSASGPSGPLVESATVKSDCPMQENYEIFKDLIQTVGSLY